MTEEQMRAIDERPSYHSAGTVISMRFASETQRRRLVRRPPWQIAADRRRRQLEIMEWTLRKEGTL